MADKKIIINRSCCPKTSLDSIVYIFKKYTLSVDNKNCERYCQLSKVSVYAHCYFNLFIDALELTCQSIYMYKN